MIAQASSGIIPQDVGHLTTMPKKETSLEHSGYATTSINDQIYHSLECKGIIRTEH